MPRRHPALIFVHVVWATHKRRATLPAQADDVFTHIVREKADALGCRLLAAGCDHEHVHLLLRVAATTSLSELMQRLKGASAYELNHHPKLCVRIAWQHGYWAESVSPSSIADVARYVSSQREHHAARRERLRQRRQRSAPPPARSAGNELEQDAHTPVTLPRGFEPRERGAPSQSPTRPIR